MAYSDHAGVQKAVGGAEKLLQLTDLENTGSVDAAVLDAAIASADAWIDSYAQRRHAVPFATVPLRIAELSAKEAGYILMTDRGMVPEWAQAQHEERERWLENLAKGLVSPGTEPIPPKSTAVVPSTLPRSLDEPVSRDAMKGF
jgi:phage gp36-like protein